MYSFFLEASEGLFLVVKTGQNIKLLRGVLA